jgi:tetratricopeptide (TPR) repeat protein
VQGLLLAIALAAGAGPAASDEEARRAFKEGTQAYDAGNYEAAAKGYLKAYQLSKRGELLFAVALSYRDWGHWTEAREYYERYLAELPNGKSHDLAVQQLAEVQQKLAAEEAARPPPLVETTAQKTNTEPLTATTSTETVHHPRPLAIVLGSVGVAAGVVAIVAIIAATSFPGWQGHPAGTVLQVSQVQSNVNTANTWATVSLISGIVAVGGVGGAVLTW